jgi:hypothetical protein
VPIKRIAYCGKVIHKRIVYYVWRYSDESVWISKPSDPLYGLSHNGHFAKTKSQAVQAAKEMLAGTIG